MSWNHLFEKSQFSDGVWTFTASTSLSHNIMVIGESSHFELLSAQQQFALLNAKIPTIVSDAECFAKKSIYKSVIDQFDGISCESIIVEGWDKIRVWFRLNNSGHKMLGVLMLSDVPNDVYCD